MPMQWLQVQWPSEPLASVVAATLSDLSMPRFCRRFPSLLNTVMGQVLDLISVRTPLVSQRVASSNLLLLVHVYQSSMCLFFCISIVMDYIFFGFSPALS